ncbi:GNAT family N-acetyltransferase [Panacibacter sp. DH6]|uniref:GNAT family N-acetyltransferase n=1 Tax=Panacibacter microcysteis TaxID=2793269 RepID=A0A931GX49_9BACT|nr:GNAT family N-acetyltransferase [Panacibacter microcysteis]MBG9375029.1 GNAT family N-acetyltransferase [Panacibacter microcysteis]
MQYLPAGTTSERLLFRRLAPSDFDTILQFYQDPSSSAQWISEVNDPYLNCTRMFEKTFQRYACNTGGMNILVDKTNGEIIGMCGLLVQTIDNIEELEIGYSVMPRHRNKGYAAEAAIACKNFAFLHNLRDSLVSIIAVNNIASQKVAVKNGMHIDKTTYYSNNHVHIYRVWKQLPPWPHATEVM